MARENVVTMDRKSKTPMPRQLTIEEMTTRATRKAERLRTEYQPGARELMQVAGCCLLRRLGILQPPTRRAILGHVMDDPRRGVVYGARLLSSFWKEAQAAEDAREETARMLDEYGRGDLTGLDKAPRMKLIALVRLQLLHCAARREGFDRGPLTTHTTSTRISAEGLENPRHGPVLLARALEIAPRQTFRGDEMGLYELRRRLYTERPKKPKPCMFIF